MKKDITRIEELLERQKNSEKIALIQGKMEISYKLWYKEAVKLKAVLTQHSTLQLKNIVLFLPNSISYAIAYFAILLNKQTVIPIGTQAKFPEILSTVQYCESDIVITNGKYYKYLEEIFKTAIYKVKLINIDTMEIEILGNGNYIEKNNNIEQDSDDIAIMLHTSGTTDNPKRVMLTHSNLIANIQSNILSLDLKETDISLVILPIFFGYCNTAQFLTHVYLGAQLVFDNDIFLPKKFFQLVEKYKITNLTAVPSILLMIYGYRFAEKYDITSLRYIIFGGGKMPVTQLAQMIKRFNTVGFVQTYGQTECSPRITALLPEDALYKVGSVGKAIPNVMIKILKDDGREANEYEIGEILVRGKNIMKGYYKRKDITEKTIQNGWLYTGDIGYLDKDKYLYIKGRKKNIIITGGINVYPEEIEQIISQCDNVEDVIVYGEEDRLLGERVVAKVVLRKEGKLDNVKKYCKNNLAEYKVPSKFYLVCKINKTYNGKNQRFI